MYYEYETASLSAHVSNVNFQAALHNLHYKLITQFWIESYSGAPDNIKHLVYNNMLDTTANDIFYMNPFQTHRYTENALVNIILKRANQNCNEHFIPRKILINKLLEAYLKDEIKSLLDLTNWLIVEEAFFVNKTTPKENLNLRPFQKLTSFISFIDSYSKADIYNKLHFLPEAPSLKQVNFNAVLRAFDHQKVEEMINRFNENKKAYI